MMSSYRVGHTSTVEWVLLLCKEHSDIQLINTLNYRLCNEQHKHHFIQHSANSTSSSIGWQPSPEKILALMNQVQCSLHQQKNDCLCCAIYRSASLISCVPNYMGDPLINWGEIGVRCFIITYHKALHSEILCWNFRAAYELLFHVYILVWATCSSKIHA